MSLIERNKINKTISDGGITIDFWIIKVHFQLKFPLDHWGHQIPLDQTGILGAHCL